MDHMFEDALDILEQTKRTVRAARWLEDDAWKTIQATTQAVRSSRELLARSERDLERFLSLWRSDRNPS